MIFGILFQIESDFLKGLDYCISVNDGSADSCARINDRTLHED